MGCFPRRVHPTESAPWQRRPWTRQAKIHELQARVQQLELELSSHRDLPDAAASISAAVAQAQAAQAPRAGGRGSSVLPGYSRDGNEGSSWSVQMWLGGLPAIAERLAAALLRPLEDTAPEKSAVELGYIRALGRSEEGRDAILRLLREGPLLAHLAEDLYQSAAALAKARAATAHELQSKFLEEAAFTMSFGGMDSFFGGLEGLVGPPLPQLHEAMRREHCMSADSHLQFRSLNYGVQTTSNIEWLFVSSPDEASLERLRLSRWPPEQALLDASSAYNAAKEAAAATVAGQLSDAAAAISHAVSDVIAPSSEDDAPRADADDPAVRMREPRSINFFEVEWAKVDEALEALDVDTLKEEEFIGARLYSGPMYIKYNAALRGIKSQQMEGQWKELCLSNRYTTTLHVTNSAVVKLGKLQSAAKVYRGVSGGVLPEEFWNVNAQNVRGGCEYGFLSTTLDRGVAMDYASSGKAGVVFEIQMGMIDRGANLSWLSQYPHENEILFAPLTGVELQSARCEGAVLVVEVRLSVNLTNRTIEEVVSKMQASALGLHELMIDDFRNHGAPARSLEPLENSYQLTDHQAPDWFNKSENYMESVREALTAKQAVLHLLTQRATWDTAPTLLGGREPSFIVDGIPEDATSDALPPAAVSITSSGGGAHLSALPRPPSREQARSRQQARRQFSCAVLAAREGEHGNAALLLRLTVETDAPSAAFVADVDRVLASEFVEAAARQPCPTPHRQQSMAPGGATDLLMERSTAAHVTEVRSAIRHERWRLDAVRLLTAEGLGAPWPGTFVRLATEGGPIILRACAMLAVQHSRVVSREEHDEVLVLDEDEVWARGEIERVLPSTSLAACDDAPPMFAVKVGRLHLKAESKNVLVPSSGGVGAVLREAASASSAELVSALLELGVGVFEADLSGSTALHAAAYAGSVEVCRALLDARADPLQENAQQLSAYELAVQQKRNGVRRLFLPEECDGEINSEVLAKITTSGPELLRALATAATDTDACQAVDTAIVAPGADEADTGHGGGGGITALMLAARAGFSNCCVRLLEAGNDANAASASGCAALHFAALEGHHDVVAELLSSRWATGVNHASRDQLTALHLASRYGHEAVVRTLLSKRADATLQIQDGRTPLYLAAVAGFEGIIQMLLERLPRDGAQRMPMIDVAREHDGDDKTALMACAALGHVGALQLLLDANASVNAVSRKGSTALTLASEDGHEKAVRVLLESGAEIDLAGQDSETALMLACQYGHTQTARTLLWLGASANKLDNVGTDALMRVCMYEQEEDSELISLLLKHRAATSVTRISDGSSALHLCAESQHNEGTRMILKAGADPSLARNDGHLALTLAVANGFESIVGLLLDGNADVNQPMCTGRGLTALMLAAEQGDVTLVRILLSAGARTDLASPAGETATSLAKAGGTKGHATVLARLKAAAKLEAGGGSLSAMHIPKVTISFSGGSHELVGSHSSIYNGKARD